MIITVHHPETKQPIFEARSPRRLVRTLNLVETLRNIGFSVASVPQAAKFLQAKFSYIEREQENPGPVYWTLAARLLGAE